MGRSTSGSDSADLARTFDAELPEHEVSVSSFVLDKYEVTVGRFRKFVDIYPASKPVEGAGTYRDNAATGWQSRYNGSLPADKDALLSTLNCDAVGKTWTDVPAGNETKAMNCLTWYVAFAFCIWDGGRLPTEAEWEYAAAGGSDNRLYPWGNESPQCSFTNKMGCSGAVDAVGINPLRAGRWGHLDLAGNVYEWVFDWFHETWYGDVAATGTNPVNTTANPYRVNRGGLFNSADNYLRVAHRGYSVIDHADSAIGVRCAQTLP